MAILMPRQTAKVMNHRTDRNGAGQVSVSRIRGAGGFVAAYEG